MDTVDSVITKPVRRLEVLTGAGCRRKWSEAYKARVVAKIEASGDLISGWHAGTDCRRSKCLAGAGKSKKLDWSLPRMTNHGSFRRSLMRHRLILLDTLQRKTRRQDRDEPPAGMIEVAIDGVTVRIGAGAPSDTIAAVLRALQAGA